MLTQFIDFDLYISCFAPLLLGIYGGVCLAIRGPDCVVFFDWEDGTFIRKIDVVPTAIYWNEAGDSLVIVCSDCFYSLRYVFLWAALLSLLLFCVCMVTVSIKYPHKTIHHQLCFWPPCSPPLHNHHNEQQIDTMRRWWVRPSQRATSTPMKVSTGPLSYWALPTSVLTRDSGLVSRIYMICLLLFVCHFLVERGSCFGDASLNGHNSCGNFVSLPHTLLISFSLSFYLLQASVSCTRTLRASSTIWWVVRSWPYATCLTPCTCSATCPRRIEPFWWTRPTTCTATSCCWACCLIRVPWYVYLYVYLCCCCCHFFCIIDHLELPVHHQLTQISTF